MRSEMMPGLRLELTGFDRGERSEDYFIVLLPVQNRLAGTQRIEQCFIGAGTPPPVQSSGCPTMLCHELAPPQEWRELDAYLSVISMPCGADD